MSLIILTEENWAAAKAALHKALPAIGSSHLAEAMAAGLGYRTHAAIRAAMKANAGLHPPLSDSDDARFVARLEELGYPGRAAGHFDHAFSASVLDVMPYVFATRHHRAAADLHFHACRDRGVPMMVIKMARQYATLEWDCITVHPDEEAHVSSKASPDLVHEMYRLFQQRTKGAPGKPFFDGSAFVGDIKKLQPATARLLAEDYFRLLYEPLNDQRRSRHLAA